MTNIEVSLPTMNFRKGTTVSMNTLPKRLPSNTERTEIAMVKNRPVATHALGRVQRQHVSENFD